MHRVLVAFALSVAASQIVYVSGPQTKPVPPPSSPVLVVDTSKGVIEITLFPTEAPKSVERVLELARRNFYRGLRFHWVQTGVIQFGDPFSRDMTKEPDWGNGGSGVGNRIRPIGVAETSKRKFDRGTVGLAYKTGQPPVTADSQIFILRVPNPALDGKYALIGRVTTGMDVVDKILRNDVVKQVSVKGEVAK
jgi:cyclophilin family peptidyl-prolyl cis-trans isomerase